MHHLAHLATFCAAGSTNFYLLPPKSRRSWVTRALPFLKNLSVENNVKFSGEWDGFYWKPPISSCAKGGSMFRPPLDGCEPASAWCRRSCTSGRKDNLCSEEVFDPCFIRCCSLVPQAKDLWGFNLLVKAGH